MSGAIINASKNIKSVDTNYNGLLVRKVANTTSDVFCPAYADATIECITLNCTKKGNNSYQRNGNQIKIKSLDWKGSIQVSTATSILPGAYIRSILVWDHQPNKTSAKFADVFKGTQTDGTAFTDIYTQPNVSNKKRFTILRDIKEQLGSIYTTTTQVGGQAVNTIVSTSPSFITIGEYKSNKEFFRLSETVYENNSVEADEGTYKAITSGALLLFTLTNVAGTPTNNVYPGVINTNWTVRVSYEDK